MIKNTVKEYGSDADKKKIDEFIEQTIQKIVKGLNIIEDITRNNQNFGYIR